jgi:PAS domain S-box-containing protein
MIESARKTILLVEDEIIIATAESMTIESFGYDVVAVHDGETAVDMASGDGKIDLILMDIDLGGVIDGPEAARRILEKRNVPIVFLTSHTEREYVDRVKEITRYGYVMKNSGDFVLSSSIEMAFELFESKMQEKKKNEGPKASEELQASEAQKNAILNGITTNIAFVDSELKIIWANKTAARSVNKSPEEMKGQACYKFWADPAKPCPNCPTLKAFQTKKTEQTIMRTPDGRIWEEKGEPVFDSDGNLIGVVEIAADITERVRTEEALKQSEQRLQFVLQGSRLGFWDWNLETGEVKRNERWAEMLGYRLDDIEFSVKQWTDFIHPDDREMAMKSINDHIEGRTPIHMAEYRMRTKDGRYKWILDQAMAVSVDKNGKVNRMSGTHTDITSSKLAEEKIKALLAEKELMLKEVHHRVKNNMNTVASLLALQEELVKDESAVAAAALKDSRNRVTSMKVLYDKLYRSDDFKETSFREYISPLVEEIVNNFPNRAIVKIEKNIDDFMIDAKKLSSLGIIINELLTNIMKYAFTGRKSGLISISASLTDNIVRISVRDDGIGMLEPADFSRAEGFGLQLVEMLTRQLGGSIKRENGNENGTGTGTGTGFTLEFGLY